MPEMENTVATPEEVAEEKTTYSKEEVDALIQQEADRRVTQALKKQSEKQAEKLREAEKLARMSAEEKANYEIEQSKKALEEGWKQLALEKNTNAALKVLADKGLDLSLVDLVVADEAEVMNTKIQLLDKAFKKSVKAEVEKRLASKAPQTNIDANKNYTTKDFAEMSLDQIAEVLKANAD